LEPIAVIGIKLIEAVSGDFMETGQNDLAFLLQIERIKRTAFPKC